MTASDDRDKAKTAHVLPGVLLLRRNRGRQKVSFDQVADHLVDFAARFPSTRRVIDDLAGFLSDVEGIEHDHDAAAGSSGV